MRLVEVDTAGKHDCAGRVVLNRARLPLLAGLLDAGFSSLATFAVGLYAVRVLDASSMGGYALVFAAFTAAAVVPAQLFFVPVEISATTGETSRRLGGLRHSVLSGTRIALVAASAVMLCMVVAPNGMARDRMLILAMTGAASAFVSPIQDHVRRMFHLAGRSELAAAVSLVHLSVVVIGIGLCTSRAVDPGWIPFGVLAAANVLSLGLGLGAAERVTPVRGRSLGLISAARSGRWLLLVGLLPTGTAFVAATLVSRLASGESLGYAEAARVLGQPVLVLALGLSASLSPRSMESARLRRVGDARRAAQTLVSIVTAVGLLYLAATVAWSGSPLPRLFPNAYVVRHLVLVTVLANIANAVVFPYRSELLGAGREAELGRVELVGNAFRVLMAGSAALAGAYAIPAGFTALGLVRIVGYQRALRAHYAGNQAAASHAVPLGPEPGPSAEPPGPEAAT